jgi:hypothetical protein
MTDSNGIGFVPEGAEYPTVERPRPKVEMVHNEDPFGVGTRLMMGTPTRGTIRMEWHGALASQMTPTNWEITTVPSVMNAMIPVRFQVADAQNIIVRSMLGGNYEWLLLLEDDVIPPPTLFVKLNNYMREAKIPVVSGLYYIKGDPTEPLIYRGRGTGAFTDFERGDLVWADGVPTGCLLIHRSILQAMWDESEDYLAGNSQPTRRVFDNPTRAWVKDGIVASRSGTSDLAWCTRVMRDGFFEKAGWPEFQEKEYPFLVDTSIFCGHITLEGRIYPDNYDPIMEG